MAEQTPPVDERDAVHHEMLRNKITTMRKNCMAILSADVAAITKISEPDFKAHLLPVVRNWALGTHDENFTTWIALAGHVERPIHVIDPISKEVLFEVPPPFTTIPMNKMPTTPGGREIGAFDKYERQIMHQANGESRAVSEIDGELLQMFSPEDFVDEKNKHLISLLIIWTRYNLDVKELLGEHSEEILNLLTKDSGNESSTAGATTSTQDEEDTRPLIF